MLLVALLQLHLIWVAVAAAFSVLSIWLFDALTVRLVVADQYNAGAKA